MEQGSPEWIKWRGKGIGSSEVATILNVNPYENIEDLWRLKLGLIPPKDLSKNFAVIRGTALEPVARNLININTESRFEPATFEHQEYPFMRYSSDGFDRDKNEVIEIKCMSSKNHLKVCTEKRVIEYYMPQCMWALMITGASVCHFVSYNPEFEENLAFVQVKPDEQYFSMMKEKALAFWECVQNRINPVTGEIV